MGVCCFIGHRKIEHKTEVKRRAKAVIEEFIIHKGVRIFLFGSRSEFDDICHEAVTELQDRYPLLVRVNFCCRSEYVAKAGEGALLQSRVKGLTGREIQVKEFECESMSERVERAGKASYVERNEEMIDGSEYCIFFYREGYQPTAEKGRRSSGVSGTKLAYDYAVRKKKNIINIAELYKRRKKVMIMDESVEKTLMLADLDKIRDSFAEQGFREANQDGMTEFEYFRLKKTSKVWKEIRYHDVEGKQVFDAVVFRGIEGHDDKTVINLTLSSIRKVKKEEFPVPWKHRYYTDIPLDEAFVRDMYSIVQCEGCGANSVKKDLVDYDNKLLCPVCLLKTLVLGK